MTLDCTRLPFLEALKRAIRLSTNSAPTGSDSIVQGSFDEPVRPDVAVFDLLITDFSFQVPGPRFATAVMVYGRQQCE